MLEIKSQSSCYFLRILDLLVCLILPIFKFVSASQLSDTNKKMSDTTDELPGIYLGNLAVLPSKCLLVPGNYESVPPDYVINERPLTKINFRVVSML